MLMPVYKKCANCGKMFRTKDKAYNAVYCSEECKKDAKSKYNKEYKEVKVRRSYSGKSKSNKELADVALEAFKHGLSYGQYVGKQMLQEAKKK